MSWPELLFREGEPKAMSDGAPAGAHHDRPTYDRHHLPAGDWRWYRRREAIRMVQVGGPFIVHTTQGAVAIPPGWRGYLAVDAYGNPYPVGAGQFHRDYEPAGEPG